DYANVRVCTIQAAKDLYGACSNEVIQTTNAWYAVGVGAQYTTPTLAPAFISPYPSSCSVPALINFTNTTVGGATYTWYFGDGTTSTLENPSHTYSVAGTYTVKLVATGCTANKDSITKNSYIVINPPSGPTTTGASRCGSGTVTLNASGTGVLDWYSAASGGTVINTGTSFTTPTLTNTTTYYVSTTNSVAPINGAPATNTTLGGGSYLNYPHYLTFDALTDLTIKTVDIYASSVGTRTIYIANSSGTTLDTKYINITTTGKNTITLNFHVVAGTNYYLVADGSLIDLYRNNTGATYPIPVGTLASITGHDVMSSAPNYYYYFYNWVVQKDGCTSARTPVTASITASGGSVTVNSASVCAGSSVVLNANGGTTYQWSTGATTSSISVTPTMTSVYSVTSTVSGCTGSVTSSGTVTVNQLPNVVANANPTTICVGNTTSISATGASTYSWSTGGTSASFTAAPTGNITYTVTGTDANGCKKTVTKSIIVNPLPNVSLSLSDDSVCTNDASVTLTGSPTGGTYLGTAVSSNSFDPQSAGQGTFTLSYSYTDANNCSNSNSQVINVDVCTGILSHLSLDNVFVFPNPASTILHIKLPQEMLSAIYSIEIFDVIGKQVYSTKPTHVETICYINALANGIYNCRITTMEHKVITKRFVKE
ncbi:MAG: PKD domain-containing protein, partial [Bacteroidia bacterium]|nr:PKD domain-containing protein [Bacteroidia bacterium]